MAKLTGKKVVKKTQSKAKSKASESLLKRVKENQRRAKGGPSFFKDGLDIELYKPEEGQHEIDIIPFVMGPDSPVYRGSPITEEGDHDYVLDFWVHFSLGSSGKQACICLNRTYERKCPICEYANELRLEGRDNEADDIKAKRRVLYNVVSYDRGEESKGVQVLACSWHYMEKFLLKLAKRPVRQGRENVEPYINFADAVEGKSISFEIEKGAKGGGKDGKPSYDEWIGHAFMDREYEIEQEILDQAEALDQLIHIPDYEEAKSILTGIDDPGDDEEETEVEEVGERSRRATKPKTNQRSTRTSRKPKEQEPESEEEQEEEVVEEQEGEVAEGECPYDHEFGTDVQDFDECESCDSFDACFEAYQAMQSEGEEEEPEPEPGPPPRSSRRSSAKPRGRARR